MPNFTKHYIGKGTQVNNLNIVRVTINLATLEQFAYIYNGQQYATFEVAQLQAPDQFGKTHTVYVSQPTEQPASK